MQKIDPLQQFEQMPMPNLPNKKNFDDEENVDKNWKILKELLKMKISHREFVMWYEGFYLLKISNGIAEFKCQKSYQREWILNNHSRLLKNILLETTGQNLEILINLKEGERKREKTKYEYHSPYSSEMPIFDEENNFEEQKKKSIEYAQLNPSYTFENFIIGSGNRLAHAVSQAITEKPGKAYNPVFFYGKTGIGKTHLMQAVGNEILNKTPSKKIMYCNSEQFLNEVIDAIRSGKTESFRNNYRKLDVLIIDDIQFITASPKTQEELFHTFNSLYLSGKQIIMASDRPPKEIDGLTDRLRSRFEGGMVCDIQPPDYETRMAILLKKCEEHKINIANNILDIIASNIESNVRELEGAITKIATTMKVLGTNIPESEIVQILSLDIESKRKRITPEKVIDSVCSVFDVTSREIKGKRRTAYVALCRQIVMYILRDELEIPLEKVARHVNRKDHTTVLHACEKISKQMREDKRFADKIQKCKHIIVRIRTVNRV
jgi:chromosomal replication initiator protein